MNLAALDIKQLHYFVGVVDAGSISKAAATLHIAQPALSKRIAELEQVLRCPLLHRSAAGVRLTDRGVVLYEAAQRMLRDLQVAAEEVQSMGSSPRGTVVLGCSHGLSQWLMVPFFLEVRRRHPSIRLVLCGGDGVALLRRVETRHVDLAYVKMIDTDARVVAHASAHEDLFFVDKGSMPAKGLPPSVGIEELSGCTFVVSSSPRSPLREALEATLGGLGVSDRHLIETNSVIGAKEFLKAGLACALLPWSAVYREARQGQLRLRRVDGTSPVFGYGLYESAERPLSSAACAVRDDILALVKAMVTSESWPHTRM